MKTNAKGLRILMVAPQPFFRARGTPFSVLHRIRALIAEGHKVDLVTYPFGEDIAMPGLRIVRCWRPPGVSDVRIGPSIGKLVLDAPLYLTTTRMLRRNTYDVLHSHEEAAFFCVRLARRYNLLHVYDMHSSLPQQLANFSSYNLKPIQAVFGWLERRVLETCHGVTTICPDLATVAVPYCDDKPHAMIENTADDAQVFGDDDGKPRVSYELEDKTIILYTGTLETYQGIDLLLRAYAPLCDDYPQVHLLLAGGSPAQVEKYRDMADTLGIAQRVTFVGSVHPASIQQLLEAANILISPRCRGTNTPLKIYGYLRSAKPIIATDLATHTQVLDNTIAELVAPTEEGLGEGMRRLLDDPSHAASLAAAAGARAAADYSDDDYLARVAAFYRQVIDKNAGSGATALHESTDGAADALAQSTTRGEQ